MTNEALVRPWRRAALFASLVAALELVGLIVCVAVLVGPSLAHAVERKARQQVQKAASLPPVRVRTELARQHAAPPKPTRTRAQTKVLVLNGNGRTGAAHAEAAKLDSLGYAVAAAADARRHDYATTVVMYSPGFRPEGVRLAHDLHVGVVGPLDGVSRAALHGGQLAVILGAR